VLVPSVGNLFGKTRHLDVKGYAAPVVHVDVYPSRVIVRNAGSKSVKVFGCWFVAHIVFPFRYWSKAIWTSFSVVNSLLTFNSHRPDFES
jgi:hypothetical protein